MVSAHIQCGTQCRRTRRRAGPGGAGRPGGPATTVSGGQAVHARAVRTGAGAFATFVVVAQRLNFTGAAQELGYVQSSVTAHIKALERDLGMPLFDRLGRRVVLTDAGRELRNHARTLTRLARAEFSNVPA
ncbi:LysR family transcriptional regulator [Streptomyces varsoviensis]